MAISDQKKTDFLWKKIAYGVTETDTTGKAGPNEIFASPIQVFAHEVYAQSSLIPAIAPASTDGVVTVYTGINAVQCKDDPSVAGKHTWVAVTDIVAAISDTTRLKDWIAPSVHFTYAVQVYAGDPNASGILLNPLATNEEWVFDYAAGVLHFPNNVPTAVNTNDIYIIGYRYTGTKGVSGGGGLTTKIEDTTDGNTFVDTALETGSVVISSDGQKIFRVTKGTTATADEGLLITNADGEVQLQGYGTASAPVDIRLKPTSGKSIIADGPIVGATTLSLYGGITSDVEIRGGAGVTPGSVRIQDTDGADVIVVRDSAAGGPKVNHLVVENAPSGEGIRLIADSIDTNTTIILDPKGFGGVRIGDGGTGYGIITAIPGATTYVGGGDSTGGTNPAQPLLLIGGNGDVGNGADVILRGGISNSALGGTVRLQDAAGQDVITIDGYNDSINYFQFNNSPTGFALEFLAQGADTDIDIGIGPKGSGQLVVPATYQVTALNSVATKAYVDTLASGASNKLQTPTDGTFADGAITSWAAGATTYSDAIDDLNEILGLLIPSKPADLSSKILSISNGATIRGGSDILLSSGVTNFTGSTAPAAGTQITRVGTSSVDSAIITSFGSGTTGQLTAHVNGTPTGTVTLTTGSNVGTFGSLVVSRDDAYPVDKPGFWQDLDAKVSTMVTAGINKFALIHSETGSTNEAVFVYDDFSTAPVASGLTLTEGTPGTLAYSSGVPHYNAGATLKCGATVSNLAGKTYLANGVIQISSTTNFGSQVNLDPGQNGLPTIFSSGMSPQTVSNVTFTVGGTVHTNGNIRCRGRNAAVDGNWANTSKIVNVMSGTPVANTSGPVMEMSIYVDATLGTIPSGAQTNAGRVVMNSGDTPADNKGSLTAPDWNSSSTLASYDAAVVAGVLKHEITDYSTYLPVGPDYSFTQDATQYVTFMFRRSAVSQFKIVVNGTYSGCWVKLPGITDTTNTTNGWWNMFGLYTGVGVPGDNTVAGGNGSNGCAVGTAMNGTTGSYICSLGTQSSTNSSNNIILVRFKMVAGNLITGIGFAK
jgi:hypothetical protein